MKTKKLISGLHYASIAATSKVLSLWDKDTANQYLINQLEHLPGLPAKVGQLLSRKLNTSTEFPITPLLSVEQVKNIIQEQSPLLDSQLDELDANGLSASIGQVHQAVLKNGETVAIKVQYPGVNELIEMQTDIVLSLAERSPAKNFGWDPNTYGTYFREQLEKETNYRREAKTQEAFSHFFSAHRQIYIPKVYSEYCTQRLLVQEWVSSTNLFKLEVLQQDERSKISKNLLEFLFLSLFNLRQFHSDFQPANWGYQTPSKRLIVYDFGSTGEINVEQANFLSSAIYEFHKNKRISGPHFFNALGFSTEKLKYIESHLNDVASIFLEPFATTSSWKVQDWKMAEKIEETLGKNKWWLRTSGPTWFFNLMRSLEGVFYGLNKLDCDVPLWEIFSQTVKEPYHNVISVDFPSPSATAVKTQAKNLFVYVNEGKERIVELEMPALAVDDLESLIPEEVKLKISSQVDLSQIVKKAQASGYQEQLLFEAATPTRHYRVFLK